MLLSLIKEVVKEEFESFEEVIFLLFDDDGTDAIDLVVDCRYRNACDFADFAGILPLVHKESKNLLANFKALDMRRARPGLACALVVDPSIWFLVAVAIITTCCHSKKCEGREF